MRKIFILAVFIFAFRVSLLLAASIPTLSLDELSDKDMSPDGRAALSESMGSWKHAETAHFVYHFTDEKEAETVTIHAELYYQWVKELFGVTEDPWKKKSQIFIFQDEKIWGHFNERIQSSLEGQAFTTGWELFIYRAPFWLAPKKTLAHEITHIILFRFLKGPIPLFLNEGFAEFVSYRAIAAGFGGDEYNVRVLQLIEPGKYIPLDELAKMRSYPAEAVETFYQESELLVRFLILNDGSRNFYALLHDVSKGNDFEEEIKKIYDLDLSALEEKFKDFAIKKNESSEGK